MISHTNLPFILGGSKRQAWMPTELHSISIPVLCQTSHGLLGMIGSTRDKVDSVIGFGRPHIPRLRFFDTLELDVELRNIFPCFDISQNLVCHPDQSKTEACTTPNSQGSQQRAMRTFQRRKLGGSCQFCGNGVIDRSSVSLTFPGVGGVRLDERMLRT